MVLRQLTRSLQHHTAPRAVEMVGLCMTLPMLLVKEGLAAKLACDMLGTDVLCKIIRSVGGEPKRKGGPLSLQTGL